MTTQGQTALRRPAVGPGADSRSVVMGLQFTRAPDCCIVLRKGHKWACHDAV